MLEKIVERVLATNQLGLLYLTNKIVTHLNIDSNIPDS